MTRGIEWVSTMLPLLQEGLGLTIYPVGGSMRPFISQGRGDHVVVHAIQGRKLRRGDILLYRGAESGLLTLHRIVHIRKGQIYCLGDSQVPIEGPLPPETIYAVATTLVRKGRAIDCNNVIYRAAVNIWLLTRPIRPFIFRAWSRLKGRPVHPR